MPPRTRTRATKDLKENVDIVRKAKVKRDGKISKPQRKALADKTNSLSDDNASIDVPIKTSKVALKNKTTKTAPTEENRPRRARRLPTRYVENAMLKNLSNNTTPVKNQSVEISNKSTSNTTLRNRPLKQTSQNEVVLADRQKRSHRLESNQQPVTEKPKTPSKQTSKINISPFKTPQSLDGSLIANRPKRICRLPSKFEDHSISPNKFIPVQPCHASTPIVQKKAKPVTRNDDVLKPEKEKRTSRKDYAKKSSKGIEHYFSKSLNKKTNNVIDKSTSCENKTSPDTNNNPKGKKAESKKVICTKSPTKQISPKANAKKGLGKRLLEHNLSFRVFEDRKSDKGEDVYEFTFDPNEEPTQKKKRKKVVNRRPPKPRTIVSKNNYEKNVQKALESLKNMVKPAQPQAQSEPSHKQPEKPKNPTKIKIIEDIIIKPAIDKSLNNTPAHPTNESVKSIHMSNYASIHIEDIAADFEMNDNDLNYSPVHSPFRPKSPETHESTASKIQAKSHENKEANYAKDLPVINNRDPLNLQEDHSFFEDQPVASSSMNVSARSVRHPLASPWRVEFGNLPIRWQADTYVKPNMTPAVESSFINSEEISKKKHVYTNLIAEEPLPQIEEPQLKQTSIISFMKEVAERSLKKKRGRSMSPTKANSLFEDASDFGFKTPKKARKDRVVVTPSNKSAEETNHEYVDHNVSNENLNHEENIEQISTKKSKENKDGTYFGFDESEDQENVSPVKIQNSRARGLRSKSRAVLQEINAMSGPTRAVLPASAKSKLPSSDVVEKLYDQLKSAEEAPQIQAQGKDNVTVSEPVSDEESVHLFEDIELVHHLKPHRKSYGKAKKVTFLQRSNSDSDTQIHPPGVGSSDEDDLADLTFHVPDVKEKRATKKRKKKQLSKKEEKEVEEWAAGFNSMCEDIDEFPLVVE